ncbi:uncharacterized protein PG986_013732 [Apiospora aurea]|uniref:Uncharacterized protein n=1 Tax=Apiospora aurea TaxID=335848 RepID=A0ABR1PXF7_9PEZI
MERSNPAFRQLRDELYQREDDLPPLDFDADEDEASPPFAWPHKYPTRPQGATEGRLDPIGVGIRLLGAVSGCGIPLPRLLRVLCLLLAATHFPRVARERGVLLVVAVPEARPAQPGYRACQGRPPRGAEARVIAAVVGLAGLNVLRGGGTVFGPLGSNAAGFHPGLASGAVVPAVVADGAGRHLDILGAAVLQSLISVRLICHRTEVDS